MRRLIYILLLLLSSGILEAQTTINADVRIRSGAGAPTNTVIPVNGGIVYADGNGLLKKTTSLYAVGYIPVSLTTLRGVTVGLSGALYWMTDIGREGPWRYDPTDNTSTDNTGTIVVSGSLRFKRVLFGQVSANWFGAIGDGTTNSTSAIQAALDFCATGVTSSKVVTLQQGNYMVDSLKLRNRVTLMGDNRATTITARTSSATGLFVLGDAPVQKNIISELTIVGNSSNVGQHCFNITAFQQIIPAYTGGLWYYRFEDLDITGFRGHAFHFYCKDGLGDMANQFLNISNCTVTATADSTSGAVYAEGQFAQVKIRDCLFNGLGGGNLGTYGIQFKSLLTTNDQIQGSVSIDNTTIQAFRYGMYTSFAQGIALSNCWFENDSFGIWGANKSRIYVGDNNVFKNVAVYAGTYIIGNDLSVIHFCNNGVYGSLSGRFYTSPSGTPGGGKIRGNWGQDHLFFTTVFVAQNINVSGATLNTGYFDDIVTNGTYSKSNYISNINSDLDVGEELTIRCYEGSNPYSFVAFSKTTGNLDFSNSLDSGFLVIGPRESVTFKRSDLLGTWVVVALNKTEVYSDTLITQGSWYTGQKIWSNKPANGVLYWYCKQGGIPGTWDSVMAAGLGGGGTPTTSSLGANVMSLTASGTDRYMQLMLTTSGAVSGTIGTVNYAHTWPHTPLPIIGPTNAGTGSALIGGYISISGTNPSTAIITGSIGAAGTYIFNVQTGGN